MCKDLARPKHCNDGTLPSIAYKVILIGRVLLLLVAVFPHSAAARPGTPSVLDVRDSSALESAIGGDAPQFPYKLSISLLNAASEWVRFEFEALRGGLPFPVKILCAAGSGGTPSAGCWESRTFGEWKHFQAVELQANTQYCFRVRARDDSDTVSEFWSGWACARTARAPMPATPPAPRVTYIPGDSGEGRPGFGTPAKLLLEWSTFPRRADEQYEIQRLSNGGWQAVTGTIQESTVETEFIHEVPAIRQIQSFAYRVCLKNTTDATRISCSSQGQTTVDPLGLMRKPKNESRFSPPFVLRVVPATYSKVIGQAPEHVQVQLTFEGSAPDRARYSIDDGLCGGAIGGIKGRCWFDAAQLTVVNNTATVWVPYSAVQQAKRQIHIELSNKLGASNGTIQISPAVAGTPPTVKHDLAVPQSPAPSREPPRVPDTAPKNLPPLQQQAPKSGGSVFGR